MCIRDRKYIHYGFGAVLVTFMSVAAYWLYRQLTDVPWARAALWVQVLGSVAALLSIVGVFHACLLYTSDVYKRQDRRLRVRGTREH